jgi:alpha-1,3-rhamnosyl/mannosyltransferase
MRIGIDGRSLAGAGRGVARTTFTLLSAMAERFPQDEWRVLMPAAAGEPPPHTAPYRTRIPSRLLFGSAALVGRPRLDALVGGADVVWLPAPAPVAVSRGVPSVLTLHDLSWEQRPADFTAYERLWHAVARPRSQARRAAMVAAVSQYTRSVALERWGLDPERVVVVPSPIAPRSHKLAASAATGDPFFLWVGALEPRKAPEVLAAAWGAARGRGLAARLVVVGEGRVPLDGGGVVRRGHVPDAELQALYDRALAVVLPSRLEGAGLPPLEAALRGTPSICSDLPPLREALGASGAQWVPPGDVPALTDALILIAQNAELRQRIAQSAHAAAVLRADPSRPSHRMRALLAEAAQT